MKHIQITVILSVICYVLTDNIFMIHSFWVGSHIYSIRAIADIFVKMGHNITILRYLDDGSPGPTVKPGVTEIVLTLNNTKGQIPLVSREEHGRFQIPLKYLWHHGLNLFKFIPIEGFTTSSMICDDMLSRKPLIEQLKNANFSATIVDVTFGDCNQALAYNLGSPIIAYVPLDMTSGPMLYTTGFMPPSFVPLNLGGFPAEMNFPQRVMNSIQAIFTFFLMQVQMFSINRIAQKHFPGTPPISTIYGELAGAYYDTLPAIENPRPFPPSFVHIGGIHIKQPKPLPDHLESFVQSSGEDGFILFSLGLSFDPKTMPNDLFEGYFKAFAKLRQKVLIRVTHAPSFVPDNVKISEFLPQTDLLAHPKIRLFVGHGGNKGVMESVYFGVPMVGIPIFADQFDNVMKLERLGAAKVIRKDDHYQALVDAISTVLNNSSYEKQAQHLSQLVKAHGEPEKRLKNLLELVLETQGAEHLKIASRKLNIFQYFCMDVILFLSLMFIISIVLLYYLIRYSILLIKYFTKLNIANHKKML